MPKNRPGTPAPESTPLRRTRSIALTLVVALAAMLAPALPATADAQAAQVRLNEAVSVNATGLVDGFGDTSDWIEVANTHSSAIDVGGWGLSDDPNRPYRWLFPSGTTIPAGGYLVVFASGEPSPDPAELHASFSLSGDGEALTLTRSDGTLESTLDVPALPADHSVGIGGAGAVAVFAAPTPGQPNGDGSAGVLADVDVSPGRGFHSAPVQVTMASSDPNVVIRYTTGATPPTAATGTIYAGPFTVSSTTTIRVAAYRDGWITDRPTTHTLVFANDVPLQPQMYGPRVDSPGERQLVVDALTDMPSISIVTDQSIGQVDRVATSVEWIDPNGGEGFHINAGIKEVGGTGVRFAKDSWRIAFDSEWGESSLRFPVFDDFPSDGPIEPVDEFKRLTLRTGSHDSLFYNPGQYVHRQTWIKGRWGDETMLELGHANPHGRWVNVFFNGEYWGQYHVREHFDDHFMASYFGGDNDSYVGVNRGAVAAGGGPGWDALVADAGSWTTFRQHVDEAAYIDWMLINEFQGNFWDLRENWNWRGAGQAAVADEPGFFFHGSDQDITLEFPDTAMDFAGPGGSWTALLAEQHPDFIALLNDRVEAVLRDTGELTTASTVERWDRLAAQITTTMHGELARWGAFGSITDFAKWQADVAYVRNTVLPARTQYTLDRLASYGVLSALQAPTLTATSVLSGGLLPVSNPNPAGVVWVTTDGSDPRSAGGAVSAFAQAADQVIVDRNLTVQMRVRSNGEWSPLVVAEVTAIPSVGAPAVDPIPDTRSVVDWAVDLWIQAVDPDGGSLSYSAVGLPAGLSVDAGSGRILGTPIAVGDYRPVVTVSDGANQTSIGFAWTIDPSTGDAFLPLMLNEYNAVRSSGLLGDPAGADDEFGRVLGNGGDWFEVIVTESGTDLRGWTIELWDRESGELTLAETMTFRDAPLLGDLASGTVIVISESFGEDLSYDPFRQDWTLQARSSTGFDSGLIEPDAGNFDTNRHGFRIRVRNAAGEIVTPFMGETEAWRSINGNVGDDEVWALCSTPDPYGQPVLWFSDDRADRSTFGRPNACGAAVQDLRPIQDGFRGDADCSGTLDVLDALQIARYDVGLAVGIERCSSRVADQILAGAGDYNGDGGANVLDALVISQCVVGLANNFCDG